MPLEKFKQIIDNISQLGKIKCLYFCGYGEPLLYPYICEAVEYVHKKDFVESIQIVSNGSLLTNEMSDRLLHSGLNKIRISLQGVTANQYKETCSVNIDFKKVLDNIEYFYKQEKNFPCQIDGKIMRHMIPDTMSEKDIRHIFDGRINNLRVENIAPCNGLENADVGNYEFSITGYEAGMVRICPMPFYMLYVSPLGNVFPCCSSPLTEKCYGNLLKQDVHDVWLGKEHLKLLIGLLEENKALVLPHCINCHDFKYNTMPSDIIDDVSDELLKKYRKIAKDKYNIVF